MMKNRKKAKKWIKIVLISILILILLCIVAVIAFVSNRYRSAYEQIDIVDRPDTYVMPDYPELDDVPNGGELAETDQVDAEGDMIEGLPAETLDGSVSDNLSSLSVYKGVPIYRVEQKHPDIVNILLLGTDSRNVEVDRGRSDTMIVVSYNKKTGEVKLVSLLRDSLVPIEGYGWNRLNTAYIFGGVGLAINTVNQLYDLDIQRFVVIDMNRVQEFVDHIGGVDVNLTKAEADYYNSIRGTSFTAGVCHLDSDIAMLHIRNRMLDNDFGRTRRQRDVITAVIQTILKEKSLTEIIDLTDYVTSIVSTNIDIMEMTSLVMKVTSQKDTLFIDTQAVPYTDAFEFAWYNGMAILSYDITEAGIRINEWLYE